MAIFLAIIKKQKYLEVGFSSLRNLVHLKVLHCHKGMKEILLVLHYYVCDLLGKMPYKRSTSPFGGAGRARNCTTIFFM
jgi:hypothetical protein